MIVLISIFDTIVNLYKPRIPGQLYQICIKITIFNILRRDKNKERAKSQRLSSFFVVALEEWVVMAECGGYQICDRSNRNNNHRYVGPEQQPVSHAWIEEAREYVFLLVEHGKHIDFRGAVDRVKFFSRLIACRAHHLECA